MRPTHDNLIRSPRFVQCFAGALALLLLGGCSQPADDQPPTEVPAPAAPVPTTPAPVVAERPDTMRGSIVLEGMAEPMNFHLYRSPEGYALPFSTYLPEGMTAEPASSGEGESILFALPYGTLRFAVPAEGMTEAQAEARAREVAESLGGGRKLPEPRYPWALVSYDGSAGDTTAHVSLGRHAGRWFHLVFQARSEALDGFGPRAAGVLGTWRWADGSSLDAADR